MDNPQQRRPFPDLRAGIACAVLVAALLPTAAHAWGPLTHVAFGLKVLPLLAAAAPALRHLLLRHRNDFLYGSLAADLVVGKNLAPYLEHVHNWKVAFDVLREAHTDRQHAFSLGFLSHLAADTVAHNYFVPLQLLGSHAVRGSGHGYWELRFDAQMEADAYQITREVCARVHRENDAFFFASIPRQRLPNGVSRNLWSGVLALSRLRRWQRAVDLVVARPKARAPLPEGLVGECTGLAVGHMAELLRLGPDAACTRADPTGMRNLEIARTLRRRLAGLLRQGLMDGRDAAAFVAACRPALRESLHGKLVLPDLPAGDYLEPARDLNVAV